jgi:DNA-binding Lrp family transcriptional regulator
MTEAPMKNADTRLIELLRANAREPTASLARKLGLARSTVQERLARLERDGVIRGYTVRLDEGAQASRLRAVVMIETDPKQADRVSVELKKMPEVRSLAALSGSYDLIEKFSR